MPVHMRPGSTIVALEPGAQAHVELKGAQNVKSALERAAATGNDNKYFPVLVKTL